MRSAPPSGSSLLLALTLLFAATTTSHAEAAPASSGSAKKTSGKASAPKSVAQSATPPAAAGADAVDPWEGKGPPAGTSAAAEAPAPPAEPPPAPPSEEEKLDPRTAYHKGNAAFRDGRFTAARHYYRLALEGDTSFDVLCNLGRAEAELKDNVPSYVHLTQCLDVYPRDPELAPTRTSFGTLRTEVEERLTAEQRQRAEAMLAEGPPKPVTAPATAAATSASPDASAVEVDRGPRSPALRLGLTIGLASLAAVGVGGGIGFYVYSSDLGSQADALRADISSSGGGCLSPRHADCDQLDDTLKQSDDMQHIALGSFIAAGALATSAVLTYVLWPHDYGPATSAHGPSRVTARNVRDLRPTASFDPARGSMWLGLRGQF